MIQEGIQEIDRKVEGHRINFLLDYKPGSDSIILFIHGLACTRDTFSNVLAERYFSSSSLLLVDLIGHGKSAKPVDFSYSIEDQALLIEKLLIDIAIPRLHIVSHSMGAVVGLLFSPALFESVESFANLEGNLIAADCGMLSRKIVATDLEDYQNRLFPKHRRTYSRDKLLAFNKTTPLAVYKSAVSLVRWSDGGELLARFLNLKCRSCYIWGERNSDMPVLERLESTPSFMIKNSGHGMMMDNPKEFYLTLANFIYS
jgi:pimeloyl-ACP methyl ester carboxylesterase